MYIIVYKLFLRLVYRSSVLLKRHDNNKIVIVLHRSNELEGNLKYIYDEIKTQLPNAEIHLISSENKMNLRLFREVTMIANARYLVLDDYFLPIYLIKPIKRLKIIQLWHAAGALKKFGYSTVGTKFGPIRSYLKLVPIHSNYTHVYVSSNKVIKYYAEAFHMSPKRIFSLGIPRTDLFNNKEQCNLIKENIFQGNPILQQKNTVRILIAPTYRAKGAHGESSTDIIDSIIKISHMLDDDKQIIFKAHPYTEIEDINRLLECPNVVVAKKFNINEWMLISDAFITDYSSAIFEYSLLKRPMAHFIPDMNEYRQNRGFYQEIEKISDGMILQNITQLLGWINVRKSGEPFDSSRMINYNFDNTENVSKGIVKHFIHE